MVCSVPKHYLHEYYEEHITKYLIYLIQCLVFTVHLISLRHDIIVIVEHLATGFHLENLCLILGTCTYISFFSQLDLKITKYFNYPLNYIYLQVILNLL